MEENKLICPKCGDELVLVDSIRYYNAIEDDVSYDDIYACKTCSYKVLR